MSPTARLLHTVGVWGGSQVQGSRGYYWETGPCVLAWERKSDKAFHDGIVQYTVAARLRRGMRLRPAADGRQRHPTGDCSGHYEVLGCPMEFRKYEPDEYTEAEVEKLLRKLGKHMRDSPDETRALYGVVHQLAVVVSVVTHDDAKAHELFQTALSHYRTMAETECLSSD